MRLYAPLYSSYNGVKKIAGNPPHQKQVLHRHPLIFDVISHLGNSDETDEIVAGAVMCTMRG